MARRRAPIVSYTTAPTHQWCTRDVEWAASPVRRYMDAWNGSAAYVVRHLAKCQTMGCGPRSPSYAFARAGLIAGFPGGRIVRIPYPALIAAARHQLTLWGPIDPAADETTPRPDTERTDP